MKRFFTDDRGNFAVMLALAAVPVVGAAGLAVDYTRLTAARSLFQNLADGAALGAARGGRGEDPSHYLDHAREAARAAYGHAPWTRRIDVAGRWTSDTDYRVSIRGDIPTTVFPLVPGFPGAVVVGVRATAEAGDPVYDYRPPRVIDLDRSAADYNRLYIYCYDRRTRGRTQMTAVADDAGTRFDYTMPSCGVGERLSYRLYSVRDARTTPAVWEDSLVPKHNYYTDTVVEAGREVYGLPYPMLETVVCDTYEQCSPQSQGGILPEGVNRTPAATDRTCAPGKFMYYGWEDRPPGAGWSDRDYNDIRVVIQCPTVRMTGSGSVRLVE